MQPIAHIRKNVLKVSQTKFAEIAGVTQATVSRWETGEFAPGLNEMALIREAAKQAVETWEDAWFFAVPSRALATAPQPEPTGAAA